MKKFGRRSYLGIHQARRCTEAGIEGCQSLLAGQVCVLGAGMLVKVQPHARVGQLGGLVENHDLVVQRQVHIRQVPIV